MQWKLPELPYPEDALEPHIDKETMNIHRTKHHNAYLTKALDALKNDTSKSVEEVLMDPNISQGLRNNAGGFFNHCIFWTILTPDAEKDPEGELVNAIVKTFGSMDEFKEKFASAAATQFGSGWAWLVADTDGTIRIIQRPNQDPPITGEDAGYPIFGIDVWEHAYYLKYQNKRPDYIKAFWDVLNWQESEKRYQEAMHKAANG